MTDTTKNTQVEQTEEVQQGAPVTEAPPQISMQDLMVMSKVISLASTRGAFRAEEMTTVGALFEKIKKFVEFNAPAESSEDAQESANQNKEGGDS